MFIYARMLALYMLNDNKFQYNCQIIYPQSRREDALSTHRAFEAVEVVADRKVRNIVCRGVVC